MNSVLKVGSRGSKLALTQTKWVIDKLSSKYPEYKFEIVIIKTQGDIKKDTPLEIIGGKGVFVKDIQVALLQGDIDIAVHSMKDMPARLPNGLTIGAIPKRESVRDVFLSKSQLKLEDMPKGSRIGTSSLRRSLQVKRLRPDVLVTPIRGNIETRYEKMISGQYDGIILAEAGINRVGGMLKDKITQHLDTKEFIPAVAQGALGIEIREDNQALDIIKSINHEETWACVQSERSFLRQLNGNCKIPIAAYATINNDKITLIGTIAKDVNSPLIYGEKTGLVKDYEKIGSDLAKELISKAGITLEEWDEIQRQRMCKNDK